MSSRTSETFLSGPDTQAIPPTADPERGSKSNASVHEPEQKIIQEKSINNENDPFKVELSSDDDPKNLPIFRKWVILFVVCTGTLCSTCASSMVGRHLRLDQRMY